MKSSRLKVSYHKKYQHKVKKPYRQDFMSLCLILLSVSISDYITNLRPICSFFSNLSTLDLIYASLAQIRCRLSSSVITKPPATRLALRQKVPQGNMSSHGFNENDPTMADAQQAHNGIWPAHGSNNILVNPASSLMQVALPLVSSRPTFLDIFDEA